MRYVMVRCYFVLSKYCIVLHSYSNHTDSFHQCCFLLLCPVSQPTGRPYSPGRIEVESLKNRLQGLAPVQGYTDLRARDAVEPSAFQRTAQNVTQQSTSTERLQKFQSTRTNRLRPVIFQPNGSFKSLKENGKLAVGPEDAAYYKGRGRNPDADTAYHVPGVRI